jgi:rSAM/selenodomain-associated transferase 1
VSTALIVMAKAPVAGRAKTRLIPALGAEGAADLAHRLLVHTLHEAAGLQADHTELCVSPDTRHPAFIQAVSRTHGELQLTLQGEGDLGDRMHRALERVLCVHARALLIGTDAPALTTYVLRLAEAALDDHDAVFVPAIDGGYALVGLTHPVPSLFHAMTWSTPRVMADTRLRARQSGVDWTELAPVHDIDEPADLVHLPGVWR